MAYYNDLTFASGYYSIYHGIVTLADDTPDEIRKKFWEVWPAFRKKVIDTQKSGHYLSCYPHLPMEEPDPNLSQYQQ